MTENTTKTSATAARPDPAPPEATRAPTRGAEQKKKPFTSAGWRIHNELTYRGVDWLLNATVGVAMTYWADRTESGARLFKEPSRKLFAGFLKILGAGKESINSGKVWGSRLGSILIGGFSIIPLVMFLENKKNKKNIVRALDETMYGKNAVANDPKFAESYRHIDEEPEKKFWDGMITRCLALVPIFAAILYKPVNDKLETGLYERIGGWTNRLANKTGIGSTKTAMEMKKEATKPKDTSEKQRTNWDFLHVTIGFDFGLSFFYAILHEIAYKALALVGMHKQEEKAGKQETAQETAPPPRTHPAPHAMMEAKAPEHMRAPDAPSPRIAPETAALAKNAPEQNASLTYAGA
jgi:hypothetical protein